MSITPAQCRAARALLHWSQQRLAANSEVSVTAIRVFETEHTDPRRVTLAALRLAFEKAGVDFICEPKREGVVFIKEKGALESGIQGQVSAG
ncbi:MAG TPA: transcriptional regulator [Dongiaceae bacterium]|nr:transcriptional regulator [Dongiaceae bacterium]